MTDSQSTVAFACGYAEDGDGGVFRYRQDEETGDLVELGREPAPAASFAALHPEGSHLYVANRVPGGAVTAYEIDPQTGELAEIDRTEAGASDPCYLGIDRTGRYAFAANYGDGTVAAIPITADGGFGDGATVLEHEGSSVHPERQQEPHPHSIDPGPENRYVYAPDLGTDRIEVYEFDPDGEVLPPADCGPVATSEGAGPRHFEFGPDGRVCYVINELDSTVTAYEHDPDTGDLTEIQTVSTLPDRYDRENFPADVHVHPSGDWLYASNRGHDSIAVFEIGESGRLDPVDHEGTRGHWPRHFAIDPAGEYLYVENRRSDSIVPFAIDVATGRLTPTDQRISIPEPICLRFATLG